MKKVKVKAIKPKRLRIRKVALKVPEAKKMAAGRHPFADISGL
jgi:hypothetical protein